MEAFIEKMKAFFSEFTMDAVINVVISLLLLFFGLWLIKKLVKLLEKVASARGVDAGVVTFLRSFCSVMLKIVLIMSIAGNLGVPMTSFITLLGSAGLAIGLSLQGSLSNLAGGLMLLLFHPFRVGDYVEASGLSGTVEEISIFYTTLTSMDNKKIVIPNGTISNGALTNYSAQKFRRVDLDVSADYSCDVDKVDGLLARVAAEHPKVVDEPAPPFARLKEMGDSALVFTLRAWCRSEDYWTVFFDLNEAVKREFDRAGIPIPFPQMDVHVKQ